MGLDAKTQAKLVKMDLADRSWFEALSQSESLDAWIDDYEDWLKTSKGRNGYHRNKNYVSVTLCRVRNIVKGCSFNTWGDIRKAQIETYLGGLSVELGTHNGYITAFKQFANWCVRDGRAEFSPVQFVQRVRVPNKEERRPLTFDEVCTLIHKTANGAFRFDMSGIERGVLYRVAIETGFRVNELRHLTTGCFDLDNAVVNLDAQYCKDRCDASQPITLALASSMRAFLAGREPSDPVFNLKTLRTAEMLQADRINAGISLADDKGRDLCFHSLRHTLRTELSRARLTEPVIDKIMRHKPAGVGQRFYGHITDFEIREGIERLPEYPWPEQQSQPVKALA